MTEIETVQAYVEAFNAGDWDGIRPLFAPNAVIRGVLGWGKLEEVVPVWRELHDGMAIRLEIEALIGAENAVAARFRETGRFVGAFRGLPQAEPTGRPYEVIAMEWFEFVDGLIARRWGARDFSAITRQVLG